MDSFGIVKDSSIWQNASDYSAFSKKDNSLRIGIVKKVYRDAETGDLRFLTEMRDMNDAIELNCRMLRKFGGVFNYEDTVLHGYKFDDKPDPTTDFAAKAGDVVLVGLLNGQAREGIILGALTHPARTSTVDITKGPQYVSEFNGIETVINQDGEYVLTFKAIPTNIAILDNKPYQELPAATYDTKIGSSFLKFDKTGSFEVNDKSQTGLQNFRIDKAAGTVVINSGSVSLKFTKKSQQIDFKAKVTNFVSDTSMSTKTQTFSVDATSSVQIKSPRIAIGASGIELLQQIADSLDKLVTWANTVGATHTHTGNLGFPTSPPTQAAGYQALGTALATIKTKIESIKGSL